MKSFLTLAVTFSVITGLSPAIGSALDTGEALPAFVLPTDNGQLTTETLKGKVVYFDFWASWCGPCRQSLPFMKDLQSKFQGKGLEIVAVNVDKKKEDANKLLSEVQPAYRVAYDSAGSLPTSFALKTMPTSFLIGKDGKVRAVFRGFHEEEKANIEGQIETLLRE